MTPSPTSRSDGSPALQKPPRWQQLRQGLSTASFPAYHGETDPVLSDTVTSALSQLSSMRPHQAHSAVPIGTAPCFSLRPSSEVTLPTHGIPTDQIIRDAVTLLDGQNATNHPLFQFNIICHPNVPALAASLLANVTSQNLIAGHAAWNAARAEVESAQMVSKLIAGWDPDNCAGLYTFGGMGCYLYAMKYAVNHVLEQHDVRAKGVPNVNGKIIVSENGHYGKSVVADWTGVGTDNVIEIPVDIHGEMDLVHLETTLQQCQHRQEPVLMIVATMGAPDTMAVDPVEDIAALLDKYPNPKSFNRPIIYCDSVSGWAFLMFADYDFDNNPLQFSPSVAKKLREVYEKMAGIQFGDVFGVDFHKTGWCMYNTSMVVVKDNARFEKLLERDPCAYVHGRTPYNPGGGTVEGSRSAAAALAGWTTLRHFGTQGFQVLLGGVVEMSAYLRKTLDLADDFAVASRVDAGLNVAFRVYPPGRHADTCFAREVSDEEAKEQLRNSNVLQKRVADRIWDWANNGDERLGQFGPCVNYSSKFRVTPHGAPVFALKSWPMSVNASTQSMDSVIAAVRIARDDVLQAFPDLAK